MENFIRECVDNNKLQNDLINALQRKKPFSHFRFVIDNSGDYRQKWFEYKNEQYLLYVKEQFDLLEFEEN
jgi:hypothetical protein